MMYDASIASLDWTESPSAKSWARSDLPLEPIPHFRSLARSEFEQSIIDDEAEIMRLEESIRQVRYRISKNRARLAPIRLVPNEMLSAIFLHWQWLHSRGLSHWTGSKETERFVLPSTIVKVCRRWSDCAIATPAIWTHGKYRIDTANIACWDRTRLFKTYFDRAGSLGLKVNFGGSDRHCQTDKIWCEVMEPSLFRLEDLTISGRDTPKYCWHLDPLYEWPDRKIVMSLTVCTRLSQLSLHEMKFSDSESQVPIVLPTVRKIDYTSCTGNPPIQCPGLVACEMQRCSLLHSYALSLSITSPLLEKVCLIVNYGWRGQALSQPTFISLKHLEIGINGNLSILGWLSDAPILATFALYLDKDNFRQATESISLRSWSALTSLSLTMSLSMIMLDNEDVNLVREWMIQAHNLVELRLLFGEDDRDIGLDVWRRRDAMERYLEPLLTTERDLPCFPHLKHVTIGGGLKLETALQLLVDRASHAERVEAGFTGYGIRSTPSVVQRPCLLTVVNSSPVPEMESVGLGEFLEICKTQTGRWPRLRDDY